MAWPASTLTLKNALETVDGYAINLKAAGQQITADSAASGSDRDTLLAFAQKLNRAVVGWNTVAALPGIVDYARAEKRDQALDVAAAFVAMRDAAVTLRDWIVANVPVPTQIEQDGSYQNVTFTVAQTAPLRTRIATFVATIG